MKNTFYIPKDVSQFDYVVEKLNLDLKEICHASVPEEEVLEYTERLLSQLTPLEHDDTMWFLQFDKPSNMPSDCRVEYVYKPTYIAASIIMQAIMRYEKVREISGVEKSLSMLMNGCIGRNFQGHGYDGTEGFLDTMEIFARANVAVFIRDYPHVNPKFNKAFSKAVTFLDTEICTGKVTNPWSGESYSERGELISEKIYLSLHH